MQNKISKIRLHVKYLRAIYKTMNTGAGNGMRAMRGTRGLFIRGFSENSGKCYYVNIPGNVEEYSLEYLKRSLGMLVKIPGNAPEDSGECSGRFRGILEKILENAQKD